LPFIAPLRLELGESVAIIGAGSIGHLIAGIARAAGASRVAVIEPAWNRRNLELQMGADLALDSTHESEAAILEMTNAHGADVAFETSGTAPGFEAALRLIRKQERLAMVALYEGRQLQLDANNAVLKELDLIATFWASDVDFRRAVDLISAQTLDVRALISAC
jgi:(R,R)-butanediol dehydrogenase / meso-butanediol dehydrogenase / diacetyl reductase